MDWGMLLLIAVVLVCPLTMFWMMRHRHEGDESDKDGTPERKVGEHRR